MASLKQPVASAKAAAHSGTATDGQPSAKQYFNATTTSATGAEIPQHALTISDHAAKEAPTA